MNFADIVPAYSSMIFAIGSTISTVGIVCSNLIAALVIKQPILTDWRILFILFAVTFTIGGVVFLIYGSAVPRKWATFKHNKTKFDDQEQSVSMLSSPCTQKCPN